MSEFLNIKDIIDILPILLNYFVPGFIFISVRNFKLCKDDSKDKFVAMKSIVISFIMISIVEIFVPINHYLFSLILIIVSIVLSKLYIKFNLECWLLTKVLKVDKTTSEDFLDDIIDTDKGAWMYLYIPSENIIYCGKLRYYENCGHGKERNILLSNYTITSYNGDEIINYVEDDSRIVMVNTQNIIRIEMVKSL